MQEIMDMIEYSVEPPADSLAAALDQCMESAMQLPTVLANVTAIICGGDSCCACTMGCMDDEECMRSCFDRNADGNPGDCGAELYDDGYGDWNAGYADPCDACLMGCDSMMDWSQMDMQDHTWVEYQMCSDTCHDPEYGACGGIWTDATDLNPCDACLIGCHEDGGDQWMDGEIAIGRPFLLDLHPGGKART